MGLGPCLGSKIGLNPFSTLVKRVSMRTIARLSPLILAINGVRLLTKKKPIKGSAEQELKHGTLVWGLHVDHPKCSKWIISPLVIYTKILLK